MSGRPETPALILVVDDSPSDVYFLRRALAEECPSCTVEVLGHGDKAWRYLRREEPYTEAQIPAVLVLDMNLPGRNGPEILDMVRQTKGLRHLSVVALSSLAREYQPDTVATADYWFTKPSDLDEYAQLGKAICSRLQEAVQ